jgi:altronate dehydratase
MTLRIDYTIWQSSGALCPGEGLRHYRRMTMATSRSARLGVVLLVGLSGCTDLAPLQARLDDLQARMDRLETESVNAAAATAAAQATSDKADRAASEAADAAKTNANAIEALADKIDRMFKRPPPKEEPPQPEK